ncbi:unnamed protein product [Phytophthora fragariaefolia]|uniref:Unnamed protein product n=1 Tax=Phytophthora fragariaefolia TaxID=1490495 RepID=A0A9W6YMS0_9STRA|nr:unnamed protein product [Phytophthora fragariaefolia]
MSGKSSDSAAPINASDRRGSRSSTSFGVLVDCLPLATSIETMEGSEQPTEDSAGLSCSSIQVRKSAAGSTTPIPAHVNSTCGGAKPVKVARADSRPTSTSLDAGLSLANCIGPASRRPAGHSRLFPTELVHELRQH